MRWSNCNISRFYCSKTANVFIAYLLTLRRHKYLPCESVSVQTMRAKAILKFIWHVFPANILIMLWPLRIDARIDMWLFLCFAASSAYFWGTVMQAKYICHHAITKIHEKTTQKHTSKMCSWGTETGIWTRTMKETTNFCPQKSEDIETKNLLTEIKMKKRWRNMMKLKHKASKIWFGYVEHRAI